jgi:hypothetical protein
MKLYKLITLITILSGLLACTSTYPHTNSKQSKIDILKSKKWQLIESIEEKADTTIKESVNGLVFHFTDSLVHYYTFDKELKFDGSVKVEYKESENKILIYESMGTANEFKIEAVNQNQFKARVHFIDLEKNEILFRYTYTFKAIN